MRKTTFVGFRATPAQRAKLQQLAVNTGTNLSWVLQKLVDEAQIVPPIVLLPKHNGPRKEQVQHA